MPSVHGLGEWLEHSAEPNLLPPLTDTERDRFHSMFDAFTSHQRPKPAFQKVPNFHWTVKSSRSLPLLRQRIIEACSAEVNRDRVTECIANATLELITNALYHAPTDANGNRLYSHLSRKDPVTWNGDEVIEVSLFLEGTSCYVTIDDPYGSLHPSTLSTYLGRCTPTSSPLVIDEETGPGQGVFSAIMHATSVDYQIDAGRRTRATLTFADIMSFREFAGRTKSFSCFFSVA